MEPIRVNINRDPDGCYYELDPLSRSRIATAHPGVRAAPMVFIGYKSKADFEALHGPLWPQIAMVLSGLDWTRLQALGGVVLHDPVAERDIADVPMGRAA